jgi:tRNA (adenine-N(1)-)-methyltransferase non-catalytic subunit
MAEKMGILYPRAAQSEAVASTDDMELETPEKTSGETAMENGSAESEDHSNAPQNDITDETSYSNTTHSQPTNIKELHQSATTNTITLLHPHTQPSIALLRYFSYSAEDPQPNHPLFYHLQALTWLQLLDPEADATYAEKPSVKAEELASWKPSRRGAYFRKFRRWQRIKNVVDNTRSGGFDGLVVASFMEPATILKHLVPLVKGGGQVVVYSPTIESLTELMDFYSRERRRAYQYHVYERMEAPRELDIDPDDFPVDPTLLLHPILQVVRAVEWQVLPSRTHPLMTSRGGPEGYLFTATRVLPAETHVSARGTYSKKRKTENPVLEQSNKRAKSIELAEAVSSSA